MSGKYALVVQWIEHEPPKLGVQVRFLSRANKLGKHMNLDEQFRLIIQKTKVLKTPKHRLSTFGQTKISYFFLSEVKGFKDRSRMRQGLVIAEKPQIITPDFMRNPYQGFGKKANSFGEWLGEKYGTNFKGLEYKFKNESKSTNIEYSSLSILSDMVKKRLEAGESQQNAIIQGPDTAWQISILKFIMDECMASFVSNIRELDEHGFFDDPKKVARTQKREIEELFLRAESNRSLIPILGQRLHRYGFFRDYEERFFRLVKT